MLREIFSEVSFAGKQGTRRTYYKTECRNSDIDGKEERFEKRKKKGTVPLILLQGAGENGNEIEMFAGEKTLAGLIKILESTVINILLNIDEASL